MTTDNSYQRQNELLPNPLVSATDPNTVFTGPMVRFIQDVLTTGSNYAETYYDEGVFSSTRKKNWDLDETVNQINQSDAPANTPLFNNRLLNSKINAFTSNQQERDALVDYFSKVSFSKNDLNALNRIVGRMVDPDVATRVAAGLDTNPIAYDVTNQTPFAADQIFTEEGLYTNPFGETDLDAIQYGLLGNNVVFPETAKTPVESASSAMGSILPSNVTQDNLTEYLNQLGTTADDLYSQIIANQDEFLVNEIDPDTGTVIGQVLDPIAQLVVERAAIASEVDMQREMAKNERDFQEKANRLQRAHNEFVATIQANATLDANQKQLEIAQAQIDLDRELATARSEADVAEANRLIALDQQRYEESVAARKAEAEARQNQFDLQMQELRDRRALDEQLANLQAQVGLGANVTQERVALENRLAAERSADQQRIADIQVATTQAAAQEAIAKANRDAQTAIANAQASQTTTLADKEIAIQEILQERDEEIARLNRLAQENIATTQAQTSPFFGLDTPAERAQAQLAGTGGAFGALGTLAASGTPFTADDISQAQRGGLSAAEQLALARAPGNPFNLSANQQIALQTALARGGLTAEEQFNLQTALARGGLSAEDQFALQTALARGGLTPEQRLAEQRATIASDIFRASPQTLGALSGVLGGNQNLRTALNPFLGTTFTGNGTTTTPTTNMSVPTLRQYQSQTPFEQGATQANFAASGQNLEESILGGTPFGVNIPTGTLSAQNI